MNKHDSIRRMLALLATVCLGSAGWAQSTPDWYNEQSRKAHYPDNVYYTGIAYSEVSSSSSESTSVKKAEDAAKAEALSKILVSVKSHTKSSTVSTAMTTANGVDEQFVEQFSSLTNVNVAFKDVPGLQCQHYRKGSTIMAFAYVKKGELARYYDRKITSSLTKIETALDNAAELVKHGEKIKARTMAQTAVQYVADLDIIGINSHEFVPAEHISLLHAELGHVGDSLAAPSNCEVLEHLAKAEEELPEEVAGAEEVTA